MKFGAKTEIVLNIDAGECRARMENIDICIADLDDCILPGNSRLFLVAYLLKHFIRDISLPNLKNLSRIICRSAVYFFKLCYIRLIKQSNLGTTGLFIKILNDVPRKVLLSVLEKNNIAGHNKKNASRSLALLPKKAHVGIISYSLDVIIDSMRNAMISEGKSIIDFYYANKTGFYSRSGVLYCSGGLSGREIRCPKDKLECL